MINDAMIEKAATSDAAFDGRELSALGAADRRRYRDRARAALAAALPLILEEVAKVAEDQVTYSFANGTLLRFPLPSGQAIAKAIRAMGEKANG